MTESKTRSSSTKRETSVFFLFGVADASTAPEDRAFFPLRAFFCSLPTDVPLGFEVFLLGVFFEVFAAAFFAAAAGGLSTEESTALPLVRLLFARRAPGRAGVASASSVFAADVADADDVTGMFCSFVDSAVDSRVDAFEAMGGSSLGTY
ncbi:MAG: hypothetical protein ABGX04_10395 [Myxococcales bacterium]